MLSKKRQRITLSHFVAADEWLLSFLSHDNGVLVVVLREMPQLVVVTVSFSPFSACQKRKSWMRMRISSLDADDGRRRCQWPQP